MLYKYNCEFEGAIKGVGGGVGRRGVDDLGKVKIEFLLFLTEGSVSFKKPRCCRS